MIMSRMSAIKSYMPFKPSSARNIVRHKNCIKSFFWPKNYNTRYMINSDVYFSIQGPSNCF